jgi:hypothetical protein
MLLCRLISRLVVRGAVTVIPGGHDVDEGAVEPQGDPLPGQRQPGAQAPLAPFFETGTNDAEVSKREAMPAGYQDRETGLDGESQQPGGWKRPATNLRHGTDRKNAAHSS